MSMYTVCGRVFYGNDLYHGLGKGSGRGRPKGSRNGYIMPGAAYMKGYEIKGDPREGVVEYGRVDRSEMRKNAQIQKRSQPSGGGVIDKSGNKLREGMHLRASNAVSSGVSSKKVDNAPTQTTRTKAPQGHGAAAATARGRELMTNLDAGNPYNMRSDPYSGRGAAANEPDGYNMHSDPYENVQGTAAENTHSESWWETLGRGLSGVASRVKNLAVRAIDTGKKAFNDARNWVSNSLVGRLAKTAYNAASKWVGDRARDLDRWWNGYDVQVDQGNRSIQDTNGQNAVTTTHVSGAKDRIRQGVNQAGRAINESIFGRETVAPYDMHNDVTTPYTPQRVRVGGLLGQGGTVDQARDYIQSVPDRVDTAASNFQNQIARNPLVRATGEAISGTYDMHSDPYGDAQYNGGVLGENGLVDQAGQLVNRGVNWANQNVVQPAGRLWNQGVNWTNQNVVQPAVDLGRHIVNTPPALNAAPVTTNAGDNFNEAVGSVSTSDLAREALARGVPKATIDQLSEQYGYGLISEAALEQRLMNLAGYR